MKNGGGTDMISINATDAQKEWSTVVDSVIREKPKFIKRMHDYMMLSDIRFVERLLEAYRFTARRYEEDDGSVTIGLIEIDLVENGINENEAKAKLSKSILEYAEDYYNEFSFYFSATNRKHHLPYVIKSLILNNVDKIGALIECHHGEN
jgi:hypothetical protein